MWKLLAPLERILNVKKLRTVRIIDTIMREHETFQAYCFLSSLVTLDQSARNTHHHFSYRILSVGMSRCCKIETASSFIAGGPQM